MKTTRRSAIAAGLAAVAGLFGLRCTKAERTGEMRAEPAGKEIVEWRFAPEEEAVLADGTITRLGREWCCYGGGRSVIAGELPPYAIPPEDYPQVASHGLRRYNAIRKEATYLVFDPDGQPIMDSDGEALEAVASVELLITPGGESDAP